MNDKNLQGRLWKFTIALFSLRFVLPLVLVLSALPYLSSLKSGFVSFDDPALCYENPLVHSFDLVKAFTTTVADDYLPLVTASFALENKLFGLDPFYFHLDNLLLHLLNVALVFALVRMLVPSSLLIPTVTALLFGIHPLHVESVMWISQRKDMLATLFSLLALVLYMLSARKKPGSQWTFYALSVLCFLLALGSKFMAVSLPAVVMLLAWYEGEANKKLALKQIPYFILMAGFTVLHMGLHKSPNTAEGFDLLAALGRGWDSLAFYLTKTVLPLQLGVFYEKGVVIVSWFESSFVLLWLLAIAGMYKYFRSRRWLLIFSVLFFVVGIFPVLQIVPFGNSFSFADRFMYLPSVGLFLLFSIALSEIMHSKHAYMKVLCGTLLVGVGVFFSSLSFIQAQSWANSETLWSNVLRHYPSSSVAHNNLGSEYSAQQKGAEAKAAFEKAIALNPKYVEPHVNLAVLYIAVNALAPAKVEIEKALALDPYSARAYYNQGVIAERENQQAVAVESYKKVIAYDPTNLAAYVNLAAASYRLGQKEEAIGVLKRVLERDAAVPEAHNNLGAIYLELGRVSEATEALKKAIQLDPEYEEPRKTLAVAYARQGQMDLAQKELQEVLEISKQEKPKNRRRWTPSN